MASPGLTQVELSFFMVSVQPSLISNTKLGVPVLVSCTIFCSTIFFGLFWLSCLSESSINLELKSGCHPLCSPTTGMTQQLRGFSDRLQESLWKPSSHTPAGYIGGKVLHSKAPSPAAPGAPSLQRDCPITDIRLRCLFILPIHIITNTYNNNSVTTVFTLCPIILNNLPK